MDMMRLNNDQKNEIAKMYKAGYTMKEIAAKKGLTYDMVKKAIYKMRKDGKKVDRWWK